jgi:hypothetical protein
MKDGAQAFILDRGRHALYRGFGRAVQCRGHLLLAGEI